MDDHENGTASPAPEREGERRTLACLQCHKKKLKCDLGHPKCGNCINSNKECVDVPRTKRARPTHGQIDALINQLDELTNFLDRLTLLRPEESHRAILTWSRTGKIPGSESDVVVGVGHQSSQGISSNGNDNLAGTRIVNETGINSTAGRLDDRASDYSRYPIAGAQDRDHTRFNRSRSPTGRTYRDKHRDRDRVSDGQAASVRFGSSEGQSGIEHVGTVSLDERTSFTRPAVPHGPTSAFFDDVNTPEPLPLPYPEYSENDLVDRATAECGEQRHLEMVNLASGKLDCDGVPPDLAVHLLALHWNRQHFAFLITYRPLFTRDMASGGPYFSKLLLNAIFFSVSKFSTRPEVYDDPSDQKTAGKRFLRRVRELLGQALDQSSIPTIQAMLLLSSSLFALGHTSAAWLYSGIAFRMIMDLGLHHDMHHRAVGSPTLRPEELEIRRRVVWAAFVYDKIISLYQGRPVSFREQDMHVPHRFLDRYEELELWTPFAFGGSYRYPGSPARAISTFTALCSLSTVLGRIISDVYSETKDPLPERRMRGLSRCLDKWQAELPTEIRYDPTRPEQVVPPPHVLSLHLLYHSSVIMLHRPFVETGHHHQANGDLVTLCWTRCEAAAKSSTAILDRYRETFSLSRAPYLISYTVYVAATIHVRIAAQRGAASEASRLLSTCLQALNENAATNPGVGKMYAVICGVMTRLGVNIPAANNANPVEVPNEPIPEDVDISAVIKSFGFEALLTDPLPMNYTMAPDQPWNIEQPDNLYGFFSL